MEIITQAAAIQSLATERIRKEAERQGKSFTDMAKIGGAAVVGGTLIGLTGGLAVPAVIALTGLVGGAVGIGGGLAAAMAGATGKQEGSFQSFPPSIAHVFPDLS